MSEHLKVGDNNMVHFKALAKFYGVSSSLVKMPNCADNANEEKYRV